MKRARQKKARVHTANTKPKAPARPIKKKKKKKINATTVLKTTLITLGLLIVAVFVALGFGFVDESDLLAPIDRESGKINALILGTDESGLRTDTMMVASFDLDTAEINMLSIPRDTKLYVKNRNLTRKITEIHAMSMKDGSGNIVGPIGSSEAVAQLTGIPINYYIEFSFDAVEKLLDTLGPITYNVPDVEGGGRGMNYEDPAQDLYIHLKPGIQELDGEQLVHLMRYRKGDSDFARMERQQNVIKAVVEQKLNLSLILKAPKIFSQFKKEISTNLSSSDFTKYVQYIGELSVEKIHSYQLPGKSERTGGGWYFICDTEGTKTLISETFGFDASGITTKVEVYGKGSQAKANISKNKDNSKKTTATKAPVSTKKPAASQKPATTKVPSATKTPTATKAPVVSKEPVVTKTPAATEPPRATKAPVATPKPTPEPTDDVISLD